MLRSASLSLALLLAACGHACPAGEIAVGDRCVSAPDGSSVPDGGGADSATPPCTPDGCGGTTPICDPARGCVQCMDDDHCGADMRCLDGTCVGCVADTDCPAETPRCLDNKCASCAVAGDCDGSVWVRELSARLCRCAVELEAERLPRWYQADVCHPRGMYFVVRNRLAEAISSRRTFVHVPDTCDGWLDGGIFRGTSPPATACLEPFECASDICAGSGCDSRCVARASEGEECGYGCEEHLDCVFESGRPVCRPRVEIGEPCGRADCADGGWCYPAGGFDICQAPRPRGAECATESGFIYATCEEGLVCLVKTSRVCDEPIAEGACASSRECRAGMRCLMGQCTAPLEEGSACESTAQCRPGLRCHEGLCTSVALPGEACAPNGPVCAYGTVCRDGACVPAPNLGEPCEEGELCLFGQCIEGLCQSPPVNSPCTLLDAYSEGGTPLDPCGELRCVEGTCVPRFPLGHQCSDDQQCELGLECVGSLCSVPCD